MDFNLDETQQDLRTLAGDLLAKEATQQRLEAHERSGLPYEEKLWDALKQAGLVDLCVPEEAGGAGLGSVELAVVLREVGAHVAPVPLLPHLVGTLALAKCGRAVEGLVTAAVRGFARTVAREGPDGWRLTGRKSTVMYAAQADHVLVAADQGLFLVSGPTTIAEFTSTGEPAATVVLDDTPAERVAESADELRLIHTAAIAAQASGALAGALKLTTEYIKTRKQFDRALAEFQAVTVQIADVYIAGRALDVAMWSGAWSLDEQDLAIAAFHVTEAFRALYTCQHLHGGLGLDVTYPLHRYFAQAKHLASLTGGADAQLDLIGALA